MHFPDTADKKKEDVKEAGELKAENVNKGNGTDGAKLESVKDPGELNGDIVKNAGIYNYSLINFTFCCLQCRRMRISLFQIFQIIYFANINNYVCIFQTQQTKRRMHVKEAGELKAENVNKGNGTDGAKPENTEGADKTGGNNR